MEWRAETHRTQTLSALRDQGKKGAALRLATGTRLMSEREVEEGWAEAAPHDWHGVMRRAATMTTDEFLGRRDTQVSGGMMGYGVRRIPAAPMAKVVILGTSKPYTWLDRRGLTASRDGLDCSS